MRVQAVWSLFEYPLDLHCSQTKGHAMDEELCLNTLWIYTALKQIRYERVLHLCLNTLWIYTALKPNTDDASKGISLNTLWIYTALKPYHWWPL